jgi:hypothetical protein
MIVALFILRSTRKIPALRSTNRRAGAANSLPQGCHDQGEIMKHRFDLDCEMGPLIESLVDQLVEWFWRDRTEQQSERDQQRALANAEVG